MKLLQSPLDIAPALCSRIGNDEARLGRWSSAHAYLVSQARAGRLRSTLFPQASSGTRFIDQLEALLRREGYLK